MTPLRQRMIEELTRRNFSPRTVKTYVGAIALFARHFKKSPELLGAREIRAWQLLLRERGLSFSTYNVHSCALRFLYSVVLELPDMTTLVPFARRERVLLTCAHEFDELEGTVGRDREPLAAAANPTRREVAVDRLLQIT